MCGGICVVGMVCVGVLCMVVNVVRDCVWVCELCVFGVCVWRCVVYVFGDGVLVMWS